MIKKIAIKLLAVIAIVAVVTSCSGESSYKISGQVSGNKEITLRLLIYGPDGRASEVIASPSGKFQFERKTPEGYDDMPAYIEIYTHDYKLIGLVEARGGDELNLKINPDGLSGFSVTSKGKSAPDSFNNLLNLWLQETETINNETIADFVSSNSASPVAYAVLSTLFDSASESSRAALLFSSLSDAAVPGYYNNGFASLIDHAVTAPQKVEGATFLCEADTMFEFNPNNYKRVFIAFTTDNAHRTDTIAPALQKLSETSKSKTLIMEHNLSGDTLTWRRSLRNDARNFTVAKSAENSNESKAPNQSNKNNRKEQKEKVKWVSVWTGAGPAAPFASRFNINHLPYYVVADSTARIRYSGSDLDAARDTLASLPK